MFPQSILMSGGGIFGTINHLLLATILIAVGSVAVNYYYRMQGVTCQKCSDDGVEMEDCSADDIVPCEGCTSSDVPDPADAGMIIGWIGISLGSAYWLYKIIRWIIKGTTGA